MALVAFTWWFPFFVSIMTFDHTLTICLVFDSNSGSLHHFCCWWLLMDFVFLEPLQVDGKQKILRVPDTSCLTRPQTPFTINTHPPHPPHSGTFVTISEPILMYHYRPKSIAYIRFTFGVIYSMGFDKCIMIFIHHYSIIQSNCTAGQHGWCPKHPLHYFLVSFCFMLQSGRLDPTSSPNPRSSNLSQTLTLD